MNKPPDHAKPDQDPDSMTDQQLQKRLDAYSNTSISAPPELAKRIMAQIAERPTPPLLNWLLESLWRTASLGVLPIVLGFSLGMSNIVETSSNTMDVDVEAIIYLSEVEEFEIVDI